MNGNNHFSSESDPSQEEHTSVERVSVAQLERLVHLLDEKDVSEIEIKRADVGMHLVLRKAKAPESEAVIAAPVITGEQKAEKAKPKETKKSIPAPLVGVFHTWAKPKGKSLVAVGDKVKVGQLVGTIQSLNVLVEVESPIAGRITEIVTQDGQAVEYGQALMVVDNSEEV